MQVVRTQLLAMAAIPWVAFALCLAGLCGICAECRYPGAILPGAIGGVLLTVGLYSAHGAGSLLLCAAFALAAIGISWRARRSKRIEVRYAGDRQSE